MSSAGSILYSLILDAEQLFRHTPHCCCSGKLEQHALRAGQGGDCEGGWTYEYVPGAGDDEETWARGLTPSLLYHHQQVNSGQPSKA